MLSLSSKTLSRLRVTIWVLVAFQIVFALATLGASGAQASNMKSKLELSRIPGKLGYNIFISVFTFLILPLYPVLQYLKPAWWTNFTSRYSLWPFLISSSIFAIFWIAATGSAFYTCGDMCSTISPLENIFVKYTNSLCCACQLGSVESVTCAEGGPNGKYNNIITEDSVGVAYWATQGFATVNMLFFFASTTIWVLLLICTPKSIEDAEMEQQETDASESYSASAPAEDAYHTYVNESNTVDSGRHSPYSHGQLPFESRQPVYAPPRTYDSRPFMSQPGGLYDGHGYGGHLHQAKSIGIRGRLI